MLAFGPVKRKDFIRYLRKLGFEGPFSGGRHQFMLKDKLRLTLPNPHQQEISQKIPGNVYNLMTCFFVLLLIALLSVSG